MSEPGSDIFLLDRQTGTRRAMGLGRPYQMRWAPASDQIAFNATDDGGLQGIYTVGVAEGAIIRRVATGLDTYTPVYSPRGDSIAFVSTRGCNDDWLRCYRLVAAPARGGEVREIASHVGWVTDWSRDGNWIYFGLGGRRGAGTYYRIPATGGEPTEIVSTGERSSDIGLSPDNRFFGFSQISGPAPPTRVPPSDSDVHTIVISTPDGRELLRRDLPPGIVPQGWTAGNDVVGLHRGERKVFEIETSSLLP
jgi:Tol biopolymer transport system component